MYTDELIEYIKSQLSDPKCKEYIHENCVFPIPVNDKIAELLPIPNEEVLDTSVTYLNDMIRVKIYASREHNLEDIHFNKDTLCLIKM